MSRAPITTCPVHGSQSLGGRAYCVFCRYEDGLVSIVDHPTRIKRAVELGVLQEMKSQAELLLSRATSITTSEGHLLQCFEGVWYAYPKLEPSEAGTGGEVIHGEDRKPQPFISAVDAYAACCVHRQIWLDAAHLRTGAGHGDSIAT